MGLITMFVFYLSCACLATVFWFLLDVNCPFTIFLPDSFAMALLSWHQRIDPPKVKKFAQKIAFAPVKTVKDCTTTDEVLNIIDENPHCCVLIKDFYTQSECQEKLAMFRKLCGMRRFPLAFFKLVGFGGMWSNGHEKATMRHDDLSFLHPDSDKVDVYGAFVPVGMGKLGKLFGFKRKCELDTSFFGKLSRHCMTTPLHANWPADTVSVQLLGTKRWVVVEADDMKQVVRNQGCRVFAGHEGGVFYPNLTVNDELVSKLKLAVVEEGDLFYFPPYCAHAVISDKGANVMSALRFVNPGRAMKTHPLITTEKIVEKVLYYGRNYVVNKVNVLFGTALKSRILGHYDFTKEHLFYSAMQTRSRIPYYEDSTMFESVYK